MPRVARKQSASSLYHVTNRGAGKQIIFEEDADKAFFLKKLDSLLEEASGRLLAWCLMDNHFHLLVEIAHEELSTLMHRLQTSYAGYFNRVHDHAGTLFESRFRSKPVETDEYLMTVVRYIHLNPAEAGLSGGLFYPWSSYGEYVGHAKHVDPSIVLDVFGSQRQFVAFHEMGHGNDPRLGFSEHARRSMSDERAREIADELLGADGAQQVKGLSRADRDVALVKLREAGLGVRQIERLTGISSSVISRATAGVVGH